MKIQPKARLRRAVKLLKVAGNHLDAAQVAWYEPPDAPACVSHSFYGFENAVTAALLVAFGDQSIKHEAKVKGARRLFDENILKKDLSKRLSELNEARKDVQYGEPGESLRKLDLEDLVSDLEDLIDDVSSVIEQFRNNIQ